MPTVDERNEFYTLLGEMTTHFSLIDGLVNWIIGISLDKAHPFKTDPLTHNIRSLTIRLQILQVLSEKEFLKDVHMQLSPILSDLIELQATRNRYTHDMWQIPDDKSAPIYRIKSCNNGIDIFEVPLTELRDFLVYLRAAVDRLLAFRDAYADIPPSTRHK